jgi:polygalacturonase
LFKAARLLGCALLVSLFAGLGCSSSSEPAGIVYSCDTSATLSPVTEEGVACGAGDPNLVGVEPTYPTDICQTLVAEKFASDMSPPDETTLDTARVQAALTSCAGRAVKLVIGGNNNAFVTDHLDIVGVTLWVDKGVTLYASRNPDLYQKTGSCGVAGINDSGACKDYISVTGNNPAIMGEGTIDGQGGEPLIGHPYSWWDLSYALREVDGSIGNPTLINLLANTFGFVMYQINLHNSPKFHVKLTSTPADGVCDHAGKGFVVWGITLLTPSKWTNSVGTVLSPSFARNTDGVDPGTTSIATCGVIACNTISTGDDHIAIKGGHWVSDLIVAHNHFGTGHGMSIGSETYGSFKSMDGVVHRGVENINIYDLTIDADSRPVGADANASDFNGIRIKSDSSRGGLVNNITYSDICMRDMTNSILISTAYNPLFAGTSYPDFKALSFHNVHHVTCKELRQPVVTLNGFNTALPAGPITLDNVIVDNIGPQCVASQFASVVLGPGPVNFMPSGEGVTVTNQITQGSAPQRCIFPTLPAPHPPPGWTW